MTQTPNDSAPAGCLCQDCPAADCWSNPQFDHASAAECLADLPEPAPRWKKVLRRVNACFIPSDLYYFISMLSLLAMFKETMESFGVDCSDFIFFQRALIAAALVIPAVVVRAFGNALSDYLTWRSFERECATDASQSS